MKVSPVFRYYLNCGHVLHKEELAADFFVKKRRRKTFFAVGDFAMCKECHLPRIIDTIRADSGEVVAWGKSGK